MKKRGAKYPKNHPIHKRHHHIKLAALFTSKLLIAIISLTAGLYLGSMVKNTFVSILIALFVGSMLYLMSVLHIIDWLKI